MRNIHRVEVSKTTDGNIKRRLFMQNVFDKTSRIIPDAIYLSKH